MPKTKKSDKIAEAEEKFKESELWDLDVMDASLIEKLDGCGIHTYEALACATEKELKDMEVSETQYDKLKLQITSKVPAVTLAPIGDMEVVPTLRTGSTKLDELLKGGYRMGEITEIAGIWGMGKSTMTITAMATCWEQWKAASIYIQTEVHQPFDIDFPKRVAESRGIKDWDVENKIWYCNPMTSTDQLWWVKNIDTYIKKSGCKLIVEDSVGSHLRAEYIGQGTLARRQQLLNQHIKLLARYARAFQLSVILTNQAHADPKGSAVTPTMGNILHHGVGRILVIRNVTSIEGGGKNTYKSIDDKGIREVTLMKALGVEQEAVLIRLSNKGITDVDDKD